MFCVKCGNAVTPGSSFCPSCGHPIDEALPSKRRVPWWFLGVVALGVFGILLSGVFLFTTTHVHPIIEGQVKAIREGRITEAYYEFTSKDFQSSTPLASFRTFLQKYPQFVQNQSLKMTKESMGDQLGVVRGILLSRDGSSLEVEFHLIKEKGKWKILSIQLVGEEEVEKATTPNDVQQIRSVVEGQLKVLKEEDLFAAYYNFGSKEFQETTSLGAFQDFIQYFPTFVHFHKFEVKEVTMEQGRAKLHVHLMGNEGDLVAEYVLRKTGDAWKIRALQIVDKPESSPLDTAFGPKEVVQTQLKAIRDHELAKAYYEFTSKDYRRRVSYRDFVRFVKEQHALYDNRNAQFSAPNVEGDSAFLTGSLTSMHFEEEQIEFELTLEKDHWKVLHIAVK